MTKNSDAYNENYMKIKFDSDDNLPLNKAIEIRILTIVVTAVLYENIKRCPQVFLMNVLVKYKNVTLLKY